MQDKTTALGIMSGSSLDGLDFCVVEFEKNGHQWVYEIVHSETVEIPGKLKTQLALSSALGPRNLQELDQNYGRWIGENINTLKQSFDLIALHGHTVFHSPQKGQSLQIGNGQIINQLTKVPTVTNFRNLDIRLGGQGAPLVPMGEKLLFSEYDSFLNLGGICNGTFSLDGKWIAGDISPLNQVINYFSDKAGFPFDDGGQIAASGKVNQTLLTNWKDIDFFRLSFPKSMGNQWVKEHFLTDFDYPSADVLRTFSVFVSAEITTLLDLYQPKRVLVTGGGAYNTFLVDQIRSQTRSEIVIPERQLIEFKEALIFAFLGLLKMRGESNVLSSCTGASKDSCSGDVYS
ncbi:MAG: anhydro-N-acetylmuramic acid kinase [Cytophagales bacterium]|nr:anhydro-N-acetylmuramic acid kinase [Cytophagales bacterium]